MTYETFLLKTNSKLPDVPMKVEPHLRSNDVAGNNPNVMVSNIQTQHELVTNNMDILWTNTSEDDKVSIYLCSLCKGLFRTHTR